jgi:hypothetical protein
MTEMLHAGLFSASRGRPGRISCHSAKTVWGPAASRAIVPNAKVWAEAWEGFSGRRST